MKRLALVLVCVCGPAYGQSTYCHPYLNGVQCDQQGASATDRLQWQMLSPNGLDSFQQGQNEALQRQLLQQQIEGQRLQNEQARRQQQQIYNDDLKASDHAYFQAQADASRHADAESYVGKLTGEGKCEDAQRAATISGFADVIATAKACAKP